mgnify:CR=1 FL=1
MIAFARRPYASLALVLQALAGPAFSQSSLPADLSGRVLPSFVESQLLLELSARNAFGAWADTLSVPVDPGPDLTPPRVALGADDVDVARALLGALTVCMFAEAAVAVIDRADHELGLLPAASWRVEERRLAAGDSIVLYSDGIPESCDPDDRELGEAGVEAALAACAGEPPEAVGETLLAAAAQHRRGREAQDDVTLLVARYG